MTRTEQIQENMRAALERLRDARARSPYHSSGPRRISDREFERKLGLSRSSRKRLDQQNKENPLYPQPVWPSPGTKRRFADEADAFIEGFRQARNRGGEPEA
jgi:hypothetical protein